MNLIKTSIKRPIATFMTMLVVLILGIVSITKMQMALTPKMDLPYALVMTQYSGAGPEEVENLVTKTIEGAIANVENMKGITSTSSEGVSMVMVEFNYGTNMDNALSAMRDKISMVEGYLPSDVSSSTLLKMDMNSMPIADITISSPSMDEYQLKSFVQDTIQPRIERQKGVASVNLSGGLEKEITIEIEPDRLQGLGLDFSTIGQILMAENNNLAGGTIEYGQKSLTISSKLQLQSIEDIKQTPIILASGIVLQLQDIAHITEQDKSVNSMSRYNGERCIALSITQASDGNTVSTVKAVKAEVAKLANEYPSIHLEVTNESGTIIEDSIKNVISNIFMGAFLSILILFIFIKNIGLTGVIAISMPLSIIGTFVLLYFSGTTLNMVSLGGLSIGVGMLVDNSVVVLENIYRYRTAEGYGKVKGTYRGTKEVSTAVAASTLTTLVVFLPFIFTEGMALQMMKDLAYSVVFSLIMSLIVAVTVVPMLAGNYVNNVHRNKAPRFLGFINVLLDLFDQGIKGLNSIYERSLKWALKRRKLTLLVVIALGVGSISLLPSVGMELMPVSDEGSFTVTIEPPKGSKVEVINDLSLQVEEILEALPELKTISVAVTGTTSSFMTSGNQSSISCTLVDKAERRKSTSEIIEEVRHHVSRIPGANITVSEASSMLSMVGGGVTVEIMGDDLDTLHAISQQLEAQLKNVEGLREMTSSIGKQDSQIAIHLNREKIRQYGLTGSQVATQIKNSVSGLKATTLKLDGTEMDIRITYPDEVITSSSQLGNLSIRTNSGAYIPLSSVADILMDETPTSIQRLNQTRYVTLTASVFGRDTGSVGSEIQAIIDQMSLPNGYSASLGGNNEMMVETFSSLGLVIVLAIILVYLVMAAQFESLLNPFIIMFTIPLAVIGAVPLLFITGESISMMSLIGCLVLIGIVVNNGIVLIDYINTLRERDGYELEAAVIKACPIRLRPILMTALTTILGQVPMIFSQGSNSEMLKGMGLVIAGGLTVSTLLTLFVVPILYINFDHLSSGFKKRLKIKPKASRLSIEEECC